MSEKPDSQAPASIEDIFSQFGDLFSDFFGHGTSSANGDVSTLLVLTPEELRAGTTRTVDVRHPNECSACESTRCPSCDGRGVTQIAQGFFLAQSRCGKCGGLGRRYDRRCSSCHGAGAVVDRVEVTVPPGSQPRQVIGIDGAGNLSRDGDRRGHLYVWLEVEGGTELPQARVHGARRGWGDTARLALGLGAVLAAAVILSLLW